MPALPCAGLVSVIYRRKLTRSFIQASIERVFTVRLYGPPSLHDSAGSRSGLLKKIPAIIG